MMMIFGLVVFCLSWFFSGFVSMIIYSWYIFYYEIKTVETEFKVEDIKTNGENIFFFCLGGPLVLLPILVMVFSVILKEKIIKMLPNGKETVLWRKSRPNL